LGNQQLLPSELQLKSQLVSCGFDYTVVLTAHNEIKIAGRLPSGKTLHSFEQLAKFDSVIQIKVIESSRFTSVLA
jgi:hypothetical protein